MHDPAEPEPLDSLLNRFGERPPPLTAPLAPEVWRRIALAEERERFGLFERIHAIFARGSFAAAFVLGCVLMGLFLAEVRKSRQQAEYNRELVQSYLRLIDPLFQGSQAVLPATSVTKSGVKSNPRDTKL